MKKKSLNVLAMSTGPPASVDTQVDHLIDTDCNVDSSTASLARHRDAIW